MFGRLLGAANRLEYILGGLLEADTGISHTMYELLLLVARLGERGIPVRDIAQSRVLTSGGATRLIHRAVAEGLVDRRTSPQDKRIQLIALTARGAEIVQTASVLHARNIERFLIEALPAEQRAVFAEAIRTLSRSAAAALPAMP